MSEPTMELAEFSELDPWERQPGEPEEWYARFLIYKDLGMSRNLHRAYKAERADTPFPMPPTTGTPISWTHNSRQWHWKERAEAWDKELYEIRAAKATTELTTGYSLADERVNALKKLAARLESYLFDPKVTRLSPHVIEQYRGIHDDLARETGGRAKQTYVSGAGGGPIVIETQWGRGGSATQAWEKQIESSIEAEVLELPEGD